MRYKQNGCLKPIFFQLFELPTRESSLIPDHVVVTIFSNIRQIISINTELWEHLNMLSTGAAFLQMGPFLKLYSTYANNHERALGTLLVWMICL